VADDDDTAVVLAAFALNSAGYGCKCKANGHNC
jgi:hypothetical protein